MVFLIVKSILECQISTKHPSPPTLTTTVTIQRGKAHEPNNATTPSPTTASSKTTSPTTPSTTKQNRRLEDQEILLITSSGPSAELWGNYS